MQAKRRHGQNRLRAINTAELQTDLPSIGTTDLWEMLERNLIRLTVAWDSGMSLRDQENRTRRCLAIARELRNRGEQASLHFE